MRSLKLLYLTILISIISSINIQGQMKNNGRIEGRFKFLPIPYINYTRSIGFKLGALPMAQFNPVIKDTISPSSLAGLFGMYSTNETYFVMAMGKLYFDEDNWRLGIAGGAGSINFQFFLSDPVDLWIPYNTEMSMFFIEPQRRMYDRIYLGLSYIYIKFNTSLEISPNVFTSTQEGLGLKIFTDYRTNVYYPKEGYLNNIKYFTYPEFMGNETESNKIEISHNHFFPSREGIDVIAARAFVGLGIGDLNFNQQFIVGMKDDIRGYAEGEYRGNYMLTLQGEYRWNFEDTKFGLVGFLGFASVFESINEADNGKILPGIGTGFRYTISKDTHMNVGMDIAAGKGDWGLYFRIGEAFNR